RRRSLESLLLNFGSKHTYSGFNGRREAIVAITRAGNRPASVTHLTCFNAFDLREPPLLACGPRPPGRPAGRYQGLTIAVPTKGRGTAAGPCRAGASQGVQGNSRAGGA